MNKLTDEQIKIIDSIIDFLNNSTEYKSDFNVLFHRELIDNYNKSMVTNLLIHNNICDHSLIDKDVYCLTLHAREIIHVHGTFDKYVDFIKQKTEKEDYINSITIDTYDISKKSFKWSKWNTIFVIIGTLIGAIVLYFTLHPINPKH